MGAPGGQSQGVDSYTAVNTYSEDTSLDGDSIESTGTDENAVLVDSGANVSIKNATITRNSEDSTGGDNSSFYGVGAAVLTTDGTASVSNSTITTDAKGGAASSLTATAPFMQLTVQSLPTRIPPAESTLLAAALSMPGI